MKNRPIGITLIAIISFLAGITALVVGISVVIPGTPLDTLWTLNSSFPADFQLTLAGKVFGIIILFFSPLIMYIGLGLLKGRKWAWWMAVIIFAANGIGDAARIALGGVVEGIFGILIVLGFIYYLTQPEVRAFFEISLERSD